MNLEDRLPIKKTGLENVKAAFIIWCLISIVFVAVLGSAALGIYLAVK